LTRRKVLLNPTPDPGCQRTMETEMLDLNSLFKLTYPMCIVCSKKDRLFNGCIVNTVFQLVPEPPMVGMSLNRQSLTNEYIRHSKIFTVSILSQDAPMSFIGRFGFRTGRDFDKLEGINYTMGLTDVPIISENTTAFIEAEVTKALDINTHTLFIARILACGMLDDKQEPMTYAYYRDIKHGRTPKAAATYHRVEGDLNKEKEEQNI